MKKRLLILFILTISVVCSCPVSPAYQQCPVQFEGASFSENYSIPKNPYCGFYELMGYTLKNEDNTKVLKWIDSAQKCNANQILLEINLRNFSNEAITQSALDQLDLILASLSEQHTLIVRFLYDYDGKAKQTEPSSREQIASHMHQIAPVINAHSDRILMLQGIFTGNCGEMNNSHYGSREDVTYLMQTLAEVIDSSIYLSVRTPAQLRTITNTFETIASEDAFNGELRSRLGLYNDGMFGSGSDLGTYDNTPWTEASQPYEAGTREEELQFQEMLCRYVPNGGEATLLTSYSDTDNAIRDMERMHVSYLNSKHYLPTLAKWKDSTYIDAAGHSWNGYDYIDSRLGYRYLITTTHWNFDTTKDAMASFDLQIQNQGFAPAYRLFTANITVLNENQETVATYPLNWDNRRLLGDISDTLTVNLPIRMLPPGAYTLHFTLYDSASKQEIVLANDLTATGFSPKLPATQIYLGQFTLE